MRDSKIRPGAYLLVAGAVAAASLGGVAALNLAMDPYSYALGKPYRLRSDVHDDVADRVPDIGTAARVQAVTRSRAPALLLGSSRMQEGFETDPEVAFNAGEAAASLDDILAIAEAAARRPVPPKLYVIEATGSLEAPAARKKTLEDGWPDPADRLLALQATHVSLHLLGHAVASPGAGRFRVYFFFPTADRVAPARLPPKSTVPPAFTPGTASPKERLALAIRRLAEICRRTGARVVFVELPVHPFWKDDPRVQRAVSQRMSLYRAAAMSPDAGKAGAISVVDVSGTDLHQHIPVAADLVNWLDGLHFRPWLGLQVLKFIESEQEIISSDE